MLPTCEVPVPGTPRRQIALIPETDQQNRASLSVCLNLAEGSGKSGIKDRRRFYEMALPSYREFQAPFNLIPLTEQA